MKSICVLALAGIVGVSHAEDFSLSLVPSSGSFTGTMITIDVIGDSTFGTHMLGGGFGLDTSGETHLVQDITWTPASWSAFNEDGGYLGNGDYGQIVFGQLLLPIPGFDVPAAGSELGSSIGSFQITLTQELNLFTNISFDLVASSPFTLESVDADNGLQTMQDIEGSLTLYGLAVPSPSSLSLIGLSGLVGVRRRR